MPKKKKGKKSGNTGMFVAAGIVILAIALSKPKTIKKSGYEPPGLGAPPAPERPGPRGGSSGPAGGGG
jgi:hypothetical protein